MHPITLTLMIIGACVAYFWMASTEDFREMIGEETWRDGE
jgi:hypothetical protein